jgi:hypothetical protein
VARLAERNRVALQPDSGKLSGPGSGDEGGGEASISQEQPQQEKQARRSTRSSAVDNGGGNGEAVVADAQAQPSSSSSSSPSPSSSSSRSSSKLAKAPSNGSTESVHFTHPKPIKGAMVDVSNMEKFRAELDVWKSCLCQDVTGAWYDAVVIDVRGQFEDGGGEVKIRYINWNESFDDWLPRLSVRHAHFIACGFIHTCTLMWFCALSSSSWPDDAAAPLSLGLACLPTSHSLSLSCCTCVFAVCACSHDWRRVVQS